MANLILGLVECSHTKLEGTQALQTQFWFPFTDREKDDIVFRSLVSEISPFWTSVSPVVFTKGLEEIFWRDIPACFVGSDSTHSAHFNIYCTRLNSGSPWWLKQ